MECGICIYKYSWSFWLPLTSHWYHSAMAHNCIQTFLSYHILIGKGYSFRDFELFFNIDICFQPSNMFVISLSFPCSRFEIIVCLMLSFFFSVFLFILMFCYLIFFCCCFFFSATSLVGLESSYLFWCFANSSISAVNKKASDVREVSVTDNEDEQTPCNKVVGKRSTDKGVSELTVYELDGDESATKPVKLKCLKLEPKD